MNQEKNTQLQFYQHATDNNEDQSFSYPNNLNGLIGNEFNVQKTIKTIASTQQYHHLNQESARSNNPISDISDIEKQEKNIGSHNANYKPIVNEQKQIKFNEDTVISPDDVTLINYINYEDESNILKDSSCSNSSDNDNEIIQEDIQMGVKQIFKKQQDFNEIKKSEKEFETFYKKQTNLISNSKIFKMNQKLINRNQQDSLESQKQNIHEDKTQQQQEENYSACQQEQENYEENPNINFQDMIDTKNQKTQISFPFTKQRIEDCLFLTSQYQNEDDSNYKIKTEILSLECIFYQSTCAYSALEVNSCSKNSMCTENYKLSDYDRRVENLTFNQQPINFRVSRKNLFINSKNNQITQKQKDKQLKKQIELVQTINKEAKVQYFLTLWSLNQDGGIARKFESDGFKMGEKFQYHYNLCMELKISDDGQLIFVTQGLDDPDTDFDIKVWCKEKLQLQEMGDNFQKIIYQIRNEEKQKYKVKNQDDPVQIVTEIRISSKKGFLCLFYKLDSQIEDEKQDLEKVVFYDIERGEQVFVFNCQLKDQNSTSNDTHYREQNDVEIYSSLEKLLIQKSNIKLDSNQEKKIQTQPFYSTPIFSDFQVFPLKIFINTRKQLHFKKLENDLHLKVVYACDKPYTYRNADGKDSSGCYFTILDFSLSDLIKDNIDKLDNSKTYSQNESEFMSDIQKQQHYSQIINEMGVIAVQKFQQFDQYQKQQYQSESKKDFYKDFFILNQDQFDWYKKDILIRYFEIQATRDFHKIAININSNLRRHFLVFDTIYQQENKTYNPMSRLRMGSEEKQIQAKFVRNQYLKNEIFCIQQSTTEKKKCYFFCQKDPMVIKKHFYFGNDHQYANQDVILIENENSHQGENLEGIEIFSLTIKEFNQELQLQNLKPYAGQSIIQIQYQKDSQTQVFHNQYPILISNLGMHHLCLHLNQNTYTPAAFIHNLRNNGRDEDEVFFGFVDFKDYKQIELDIRNINIDACQKFMYLTKSQKTAIKNGKEVNRVYLNLLIVNSLNKKIQVVNFQSSKVFYFSKEAIFQDMILKNISYLKNEEFRVLTQFQKSLHLATLEPDILVPFITQFQKSLHSAIMEPQIFEKEGSQDQKNKQSLLLTKFRNQFKGHKVEVYMFQDKQEDIIYYAEYADNPDFSENDNELIEIKQYNSSEEKFDKRLITLLKIKTLYLILFKQLDDNLFVIIDSQAKISLYEKNKNAFEKVGRLHMHPQDQKILQSINGDYLDAVITKNLLVIGNHIFYLFENKSQIYDGILERENLLIQMKSDISFVNINGPIKDAHQDNFVFIFGFKDSSNDFFIFKQIIYQMPDSYKYNLVNYSEDLCSFSTFQPAKNGLILAQIGKKFMYFHKKGHFMDEVQFLDYNEIDESLTQQKFMSKSQLNKKQQIKDKKDNYQEQNREKHHINFENLIQKQCYIVYWFEFICQIDSGVNKLIFYNLNDAKEYYKHMILKKFTALLIGVNQTGQLYKQQNMKDNNQEQNNRMTQNLTESIETENETLKQIYGFEILEYADEQKGIEQKACIKQAREDYFQRYKMIFMSEDGLNFLFFDKLKEQYALWEINDQREKIFKNIAQKQQNDWEKHNVLVVEQGKKQDNQQIFKRDILKSMKLQIKNLTEIADQVYYAEDKYPFNNCKSTKNFIINHLKSINLQKKGVKMVTHRFPQGSWKMFPSENLLNDNMTKFCCLGRSAETEEMFIELTFDNAVQISAIGFKSANNYKHLDPKSVEILTWDSDNKVMMSEFFVHSYHNQSAELVKVIPLNFEHRLQTLVFLKKNPWQIIKKIKIIIKPNQQQDLLLTDAFQLSQLLIYKKKKHFNYIFIKKANLEFFDNEKQEVKAECRDFFKNKMLDELIKSYDPEREKGFGNINYSGQQNEENEYIKNVPFYFIKKLYLAFINQRNIEKQIIQNEHATQVIFAYCDQYGYDYSKQQNNFDNNNLPQIGFKGIKFDVKHSEKMNDQQQQQNVIQLKAFEKHIGQINQENQQREIRSLAEKIDLLEISIQKDFIDHCGREINMKDNDLEHQKTIKIRELQFNFYEIVKIKFGSIYTIVNQGNQISYIPTKNVIENVENSNLQNSFVKISQPDKKYNKPRQNFSYLRPWLQQQQTYVKVLSQSFTSAMDILEIHFTADCNKIVIIAFETEQQILIITTWNLEQDQEDSMLQFQVSVSDPKQIQYQLLQGVHGCKDFLRPINCDIGSMNFILFDNMIIDLESNIPYLYSPLNITTRLRGKKRDNEKKLFKDSSRFLGISNPQQIIFTNNKMDLLYMRDIQLHQDQIDILSQNLNILQLFKLKFKETSLFHHFADDTDMITLFHKQFIQANHQFNIQDYQNRMLPLMILDNKDQSHLTALQKALVCQKPGNFEMMIDMITCFQEICRSKIMLENIQQMVKQGFKEALEYFDQSQFSPPLFQNPYVVDWPEDQEYFIFASSTSLVSEEMLKNRLGEKDSNSFQIFIQSVSKIFNSQCFEKKKYESSKQQMNLTQNINTGQKQQENIQKINEEKNINTQKSDSKYNLKIDKDGLKQSWRRVNVQALNFDCIFSEDNLENFLVLLNDEANIAVYSQTNIKVLIDFIWSYYYWPILIYEFFPYVFYLIVFNVLTSNYGYMQSLHSEPQNSIDNVKQKKIQTTLIVLTFTYIIKYFKSETMRLYNKGIQKFIDLWNLIALLSVFLNLSYIIILLHQTKDDQIDPNWKQTLNTIGAFASFILWINMFYWMKIFNKPAYFVAQLAATIEAIKGFVLVSHLVVFAFANFFLIIDYNIINANENKQNKSDPDLAHYNNDNLAIPAINAIINMYMVALGQFNFGPYSSGPNVYECWFMILFASLVIIIMFMNMLIAVMSQPFADVQTNEETYRNMQIVELIVAHLDLVNLKDVFKNKKYIIVLRPESNKSQDQDNLTSELKEFKIIHTQNQRQILNISKRLKNFINQIK